MGSFKLLGGALLLASICSALTANAQEAQSLILTTDGGKSVLCERLVAASSAVKGGKLVVLASNTASEDLDKAMKGLPDDVRKNILVVRGPNPYKWIIDTTSGWEKLPDGTYRLIGRHQNEKDFYGQNEGPMLSAILSLCSNDGLSLPRLSPIDDLGQGGNIVRDGAGTCVISEDALDAREILVALSSRTLDGII